jgi:hypothetical protein
MSASRETGRGLSARVTALQDILTPGGLTIARQGDKGLARQNVKPREPENWNRILVFWGNKKRGYWCDPAFVQFTSLTLDAASFIAMKASVDLYQGAPSLPEQEAGTFHFGDNLRLCRESRHITQTAMGHEMGKHGFPVAQSTICFHESRAESPGGKFVEVAAKVLSVPVFSFFVDWKNCDIFSEARKFMAEMSNSLCE